MFDDEQSYWEKNREKKENNKEVEGYNSKQVDQGILNRSNREGDLKLNLLMVRGAMWIPDAKNKE